MTSVVIIGASHAAAEAVSTLKRKGFDGTITLIGDEQFLPYHRPPLSKQYFTDEMTLEQLYIRGSASYDDFNVVQKLGVRAESIDRQNRQVRLETGEKIPYHKLIIATGTRVRTLTVEGSKNNKIKYLRTKQDVDSIKKLIIDGTRLLIVGGGYIGLEVAASAVQRGVSVTVIEAMERVLQRVTSPLISEFYQSVHAAAGVDVRLKTTLQRFVESNAGVSAILSDGSALECDCAIVGIGVLPNIELAEQAGLACANGIVVDEFCRTDDHDIYAVGDCSYHPNFIYDRHLRLESVPNAVGQARTAALSICGEPIRYDEVPWFWSDQYNLKLQTAGLCQGYDEIVMRGDKTANKFSVFYLQQGRLLAADAINSPADFMISKKLIAARTTPDITSLADLDVPLKTLVT